MCSGADHHVDGSRRDPRGATVVEEIGRQEKQIGGQGELMHRRETLLNDGHFARRGDARDCFLPDRADQGGRAVKNQPLPFIIDLQFGRIDIAASTAKGQRPDGCVDQDAHLAFRARSFL